LGQHEEHEQSLLDPGHPVHAGECDEEEDTQTRSANDADVVIPATGLATSLVHNSVEARHGVLVGEDNEEIIFEAVVDDNERTKDTLPDLQEVADRGCEADGVGPNRDCVGHREHYSDGASDGRPQGSTRKTYNKSRNKYRYRYKYRYRIK
jgi:hypothetical protein